MEKDSLLLFMTINYASLTVSFHLIFWCENFVERHSFRIVKIWLNAIFIKIKFWDKTKISARAECFCSFSSSISQLMFYCSNSTIETLEKVWNMIKVNNKNAGNIKWEYWPEICQTWQKAYLGLSYTYDLFFGNN